MIPFGTLPPRDHRALIALLASIGGAIGLTVLAAALALLLWRGGWPIATSSERIAILGKSLLLALAGSLVVLISLGLAINRRSVKLSRDGLDISGGDDPTTAATVTTTTTVAAATPTPALEQ